MVCCVHDTLSTRMLSPLPALQSTHMFDKAALSLRLRAPIAWPQRGLFTRDSATELAVLLIGGSPPTALCGSGWATCAAL